MALSIRMSRGGRKGRPHYSIVVADRRAPRDGRYIEKLGTHNPLLATGDERRIVLNEERIKYWLSQGAEPSSRVARFLGQAGIIDMPKWNETPQKSAPGQKAQERIKDKADKAEAAAEAAKQAEEEAKAAAEAPAEEAPAEEAPAEEAAAEAPAEEAAAEAPAEEAAAEAPAEAEEEKKAE
ncbi:MAG: 30S ribosomal protein S16 [Rhodospirillales bacterium]|nr:30S ribosomal protein S16 [Rhodospirillales bacterium]